jgi:hypothetical protein
MGVTRASSAVMKSLDFLDFTTKLKESVIAIGEIWASSFGGSSGALYGVFLANACMFLNDCAEKNTS